MCAVHAFQETDRLSAAEIAALTAGLRTLPGRWSLFPSVGCDGEVTLLAAPAAWSEEDRGVIIQRFPHGLRLLLSAGEALETLGTAPDVPAAIRLMAEAAQRHALAAA